jgi:hypothetical protein
MKLKMEPLDDGTGADMSDEEKKKRREKFASAIKDVSSGMGQKADMSGANAALANAAASSVQRRRPVYGAVAMSDERMKKNVKLESTAKKILKKKKC